MSLGEEARLTFRTAINTHFCTDPGIKQRHKYEALIIVSQRYKLLNFMMNLFIYTYVGFLFTVSRLNPILATNQNRQADRAEHFQAREKLELKYEKAVLKI